MISKIVQAYLNKYATNRNDLLARIIPTIPENIDLNFPSLNTYIKSTTLNRFFELVYTNLLVLYARISQKASDQSLTHTITKSKINDMKNRITKLEEYITSRIPLFSAVVALSPVKFEKTRKSQDITLGYSSINAVYGDEVSDVSITTYPNIKSTYVFPKSKSIKDILFESGTGALYLERSLFSDYPLSAVYNDQVYNGCIMELKITMKEATNISRIYMNALPTHMLLLRINAKQEDADISIGINETITNKYEYILDAPINVTSITFIIGVPFPSLSSKEESTQIDELYTLLETVKYLRRNSTDMRAYVASMLPTKSNTLVYKYRFGLYNIKLEDGNHYDDGYVYFNRVPVGKNIMGFYLETNTSKPENTYIDYLLKTDIGNYVIIPSIDTAAYISEYTSKEDAGLLNIRCINSDTPTNSGSLYIYENVEQIVKLTSLSLSRYESFSGNNRFFSLQSNPLSITAVTSGTDAYTYVASITDFSSNVSSLVYTVVGNVVIINTPKPNSTITIEYKISPTWLQIIARLRTDNPRVTPSITSSFLHLIETSKTSGLNKRTIETIGRDRTRLPI